MQIKQQVKQILNNSWFFPIILLNYGLFSILFAEKFPANNGFGTDGYVYQTLITQFNHSFFFDSFYIHRILPSFLIRNFLLTFSMELSPQNIFYGFEILNLLSIVAAAFFLKKILLFFNIHFKNQMLAFLLLFVNFALLKWPFYFPAMTDTLAFSFSIMLLYYYLRQNITGMIIVTTLLAFTWPMAYYQGLVLIAFPYQKIKFQSFSKRSKMIIYTLSAAAFLCAFFFIIVIGKAETHLIYVPKINRDFLLLSVISVVVIYIAFSKLFMNAKLFDAGYFYRSLKNSRIVFSLAVFFLVTVFIKYLNLTVSTIYDTSSILENPVVHSLVRPFLTIVAHFTFFGITIILLFFYWKDFINVVNRSGWGLVGAFALNLFLFGIMPESRTLINLFPWVIVFFIVAIDKIDFQNVFYIAVTVLSIVASRIWLIIDLSKDSAADENGSIDFPGQRFYMNLGPWMSEKAYYYQAFLFIVCFAILFFILYRIKWNGNNKLQIIRRHEIVANEK